MSERLNKTPDLTHRQPGCPGGTLISRMCFACNKARPELGGHMNKRTRMWYCAACKPKAKP